MQATLRQQGGAAVLTVPMAILQKMGWEIGNKINLEPQGEQVVLTPVKRKARGRKSIAELLTTSDSKEIENLHASISELTSSNPVGKEVW